MTLRVVGLVVAVAVALASCGRGAGPPPADAGPGPGELSLLDQGEIDPAAAPPGFGAGLESVGDQRTRLSALSPDGDVTVAWSHQGEIRWRCKKGCRSDVRVSDEVSVVVAHGEAAPTRHRLDVDKGPFVLAAGVANVAVIGGVELRVWPRDGKGGAAQVVTLVAPPRLAAWLDGDRRLLVVTGDLDVAVLDATAGFAELGRWQAEARVAAIAPRPDGQSIALAIPGAIEVHAPDGSVRGRAAIADPVTALRWGRAGDHLLVASADGGRLAVRRFAVRP